MCPAQPPNPRPESYRIHLSNFEGPLDLLLHLIRREEMNIYDIPIARITEQYLEEIRDLAAVDIDLASEFLVMAATLLGIKSRMLLPKPPALVVAEEPEDAPDDPRAELIRQLVAYSHFKEVAGGLRDKEEEMSRIYGRGLFVEEPAGPPPLQGLTIKDLVKAFESVLNDEWNWREVPREEIPLREKIREIIFRLSRQPGGIRFQDLFSRGGGRLEIVVTFLALLELMRRRQAVALQSGIFGEIMICRVIASEPPIGESELADEE